MTSKRTRTTSSLLSALALSAAAFAGGSDDCATPEPIFGQGVFLVDTTLATTGTEGQNEPICNSLGHERMYSDVWFEWTADASGLAMVSMCGLTTLDARMAAYPGSGCPADFTALACNEDTCGLQPEMSFAVSAGESYLIQVGHWSESFAGTGAFSTSIDGDVCICDDYCYSSANSVSALGSRISAVGISSLSANDLRLVADHAPSAPAMFYFGPQKSVVQFGAGYRCVGGPFTRLPVILPSGGTYEYQLDLAMDGVTVGTHYFQCWYRDPSSDPNFNLSNGLRVEVYP